ncbi:alpha/beta hydrolase [Flagellimonas taeanensis]|uniref:alpha/beta hydrolase n=1 Tax=Flavobacteriaceae TaxID=49546 RepID=UPI000E6A8657|nr:MULTISPECIES: alpha/beta hydrolase [Allomuricauda]MDC6386045.1 alpha/beta hydrolase [Muricauda sp. SK9]RIV50286.1 alpha/beta hydrolase [Allomuricauda taeanensis]
MKKLLNKIMPLAYGQYYNAYSLIAPKKVAHNAFHLFCTVRKGRVLPQQAEYLERAKLTVENVANHQLQVYHWPGNKETVLLVHGWESNTFRWRNLIKKLQEADFNIIGFDAPSHGHSSGKHLYVPLYEEAVDHMVKKYGPKHLIGHSVGGMTIMYNQYKNPCDHVEKMVTIGSPSEFYEIMTHFQKILKFNNRVLSHLDDYVMDRFGFRIHEFSTSSFARSIDKKGLLFHDKLDNITLYHASVQVNANWKDSSLVSTEGLGHSMHQDDVNDQIISFLEA